MILQNRFRRKKADSILIRKTVIFMGYSCNNKCVFCCNENKRQTVRDKSTEEIQKDLIKARKEGSTYVELIGGEPTIRKDIFKIVYYAKKLKFKTIMFATNGRLFSNKRFTKKILQEGVNHIIFSIHGPNSKIHDNLTRVPGSFEQLINGIENLKGVGFRNIGTNTTIVNQNYKQLPKIGELIYNLDIRNAEFIFVDPTCGAPLINFHEIVPSYEETAPYVNKLLKFGKDKKIKHWHVRYYPLCFVDEKYHGQISEIHEKNKFHTEHLAPDFRDGDVSTNRERIARIKTEQCLVCKYEHICEGYWKEYVKRIKKPN